MKVAIYACVSTRDKGQDPENQVHQLRDFAEQHGSIYKVFTEVSRPATAIQVKRIIRLALYKPG